MQWTSRSFLATLVALVAALAEQTPSSPALPQQNSAVVQEDQEKVLQARLAAVSREAHHSMDRMQKQLKQAVQAARHSERRLRSQLQITNAQLVSVKRSLADQSVHEGHEAAGKHSHASALRARVAAVKRSDVQLRARLAEATKSAKKLKAQVVAARREASQAESNLARAKKATAAYRAQSGQGKEVIADVHVAARRQRQALVSLQESMSKSTKEVQKLRLQLNRTVAKERRTIDSARREKVGLLKKIDDLQDEEQSGSQTIEEAEKKARAERRSADARRHSRQRALRRFTEEANRTVSSLHASIHKAVETTAKTAEAIAAAKQKVALLTTAISQKEQKLHEAQAQNSDLRTSRDAATKGETAFQQMDAKAEASLKHTTDDLAGVRRQLQQYEDSNAQQENVALKKEHSTLTSQLSAIQKTSQQALDKSQEQLRELKLNVATKVKELTAANASLTSQLKKTQDAMRQTSEEENKEHDQLLRTTQEAFQASQRIDQLSASLATAQKAAEQGTGKVSLLRSQVTSLKSELDSAVKELETRTNESATWRTRAEKSASALKEAVQAQGLAEKTNRRLRAQVSSLAADANGVDELAASVEALRAAAKKNISRLVQLREHIERMRDLKEQYSNQYDVAKKESDTWHAKADDLDKKLQASRIQVQSLVQQRDSAEERVRMTRSQEDEYFEDNSRLQDQTGQLSEKLKEEQLNAETGDEEVRTLRAQEKELRTENDRQNQNSHAAWTANEKELMEARRDLHVAKMLNREDHMNLRSMEDILTDAQRHTLGLPPRPKPPPPKKVLAATQLRATPVSSRAAVHASQAPAPAAPPKLSRKAKEAAQLAAAEAASEAAMPALAELDRLAPKDPPSKASASSSLPTPRQVEAKPVASHTLALPQTVTEPPVLATAAPVLAEVAPAAPIVAEAAEPEEPAVGATAPGNMLQNLASFFSAPTKPIN